MENMKIPPICEDIPGMIGPANWTPSIRPEDKAFLQSYFSSKQSSALASLPVICRWDDCVYRGGCPLYQLKVTPSPIGRQCPLELSSINEKMTNYKREMEIKDEDVTDMSILKELITWEILENRAQMEMAMDPKLMREAVAGVDKEGDPIMREILHPAINMLEKAAKTVQKYRESLIATREAKAKDKTRKQPNFSEFAAEFQKKIAAKIKQMAPVPGPIIDAVVVPEIAHTIPIEPKKAPPSPVDELPDFGR